MITLNRKTETRQEHVQLFFEMDGNEANNFRNELLNVGCTDSLLMSINPEDTFKFTYTFFCSYFGDIESRLKALLHIIETANITKATTKEWNHGRSLVLDLARLMEDINIKMAMRMDFRHPDTVPPKGWWQKVKEFFSV